MNEQYRIFEDVENVPNMATFPLSENVEKGVETMKEAIPESLVETEFKTDLTGKRVFVVDAYGLVYQVFHALPPMFGKDGEIVNAVFGFVRDLFLILEHQKPDLLFCAFDLHAPTFRAKMFADYKATREKMPDELIEQIPRIRELLDAMRIPVLAMEGFEADDILATVAERVTERGGKCVLVTSDKDSRQLISEQVSIFSLRRNLYLDRKFLEEDWGIEPEQVVDYQALVGDSSDNVPGIALIGPKVAKELLGRFGTLEEILKPENLEAFFGPKPTKRKENLLNGAETARLCQTLVRLERNVPIPIDWESGIVRRFEFESARPLFTQYAFRSMLLKSEVLERKFHGNSGSETASGASGMSSGMNSTSGISLASQPAFDWVSGTDSENETETHVSDVFEDSIRNRVEIPFFEGRFEPETAEGTESAPEPEAAPEPEVAEGTKTAEGTNHPKPSESGTKRQILILAPAVFSDQNFSALKRPTEREAEGSEASARKAENDQLNLFPMEPEEEAKPETECENRLAKFLHKNQERLADPETVKVGFNLKRVRNQLRKAGFSLCGPQFDVMVAAYILEPDGPHDSLRDLAEAFPETAAAAQTPEALSELEQLQQARPDEKKKKKADEPHLASLEAFQTPFLRHLFEALTQKLTESRLGTVCFGLEFPLMEVLAAMEFEGIFVKPERLKAISARFAARIQTLTEELHAMVQAAGGNDGEAKSSQGLNLNSPIQLRKILFETLGLPILHKTKTGPSTDAQTLEELAAQHEFPAKLLEYRQMVKLQSTYVEALPKLISPEDHRIHTTFNQAVTATGRLSSSDPNLQNIPVRTEEGKLIRSAFVPEKTGWAFVSADYSQIELRVLAHYCGDRNLCEAFRQDQDIHLRVASQIHGIPLEEVTKEQRRAAKTVNFGVLYGQSAFGLAAQLKIPQDEARTFIQTYFMQFPTIQAFLETVLNFARENGYVSTLFGRRRRIEGVRPFRKGQLNLAERMAINTVIQGSAADLIKLAMLRVYARLRQEKLQSRLLLQIHDELLLECPPDEIERVRNLLETEMTSAWKLNVPLKVEVAADFEW